MRAYDTTTDRVVALKVLPANYADDQIFQERFRREARAAAGLDEPHVVPIHDFGEIGSRFFVSMRLIKGQDLQTLLDSGPLEPDRAVGIIEQIASALHAAHRVGLVHRDVKPSNILIAEDDFAYLIDFGIARAAGETGLTNTGATVGTWAYMAPERFRDGEIHPRVDVYALACVLYQCFAGQPPFPGNTIEQIALAHLTQPPPKPSELRSQLNATMDQVIATGMAKETVQRYATTKDLANAARAALTTPIPRPRASAPTPTARADTALVGSPGVETPASGPPSPANGYAPTAATDPAATGPTVEVVRMPSTGDRLTQKAPVSGSSDPTLFARPAQTIEGPPSRRLDRRTKIALAAVAALAVVVIAVVATLVGNKSSSRGGVASPTSVFSAPPTTQDSSSGGTPTAPTDDPKVQRLLQLVPRDVKCMSNGTIPGEAARLECTPPGFAKALGYIMFDNKAALDNYTSGFDSMSVACPGGGKSPLRWHRAATPAKTEGTLFCTVPGDAEVAWTIDSDLLYGFIVANGNSHDQVYQWWAAHYQ